MKAMVCHAFGPPETMVVEEVADPVAGPGQVLVEVHAAGVNYTDVLSTSGRSQLGRSLPMIAGVEAAGMVRAVGEGVARIKPGDRVLGHTLTGGFAELCVFKEDEVVVIPDAMDMPAAASFYIASKTSDYALIERGKIKAGDLLLVLGAGSGAGMAAVQIGKAAGARVIAAASSQAKLDLATEAGADAGVLYPAGPLDLAQQKALVAELLAASPRPPRESIGSLNSVADEAGFDLVYDAVGGTYAEAALRALAFQGRYLSVGFSAGVPKIALGPVLFKNADVMGIQPTDEIDRLPGLATEAMARLFRWYEEGKVRPLVTATFPLDRAPEALALLLERKAAGRVVVTMR